MKASKAQIEKALKAPGETRFFLLHGPDESGSRALAKALAGGDGRGRRSGSTSPARELKADPARLADEAASISMFGDARWILVEPAGDEIVPALEALLEAPAAGNPVAVVAGALKPASKLLKLALAAPGRAGLRQLRARRAAMPAGWRWSMARGEGLIVRPDVARRIAEAVRRQPGADRPGAGQVRALCRRLARGAAGRSTMTWSTRSAPAATKATCRGWSTAPPAATRRRSRPSWRGCAPRARRGSP